MTQQEAVQAIVAFAVQTKLANLTTLVVFSEGFTQKILSPGVNLDAKDYQALLHSWKNVASRQNVADIRTLSRLFK